MRIVLAIFFVIHCCSAVGTNYYVRVDGGTRYSSFNTSGDCDGMHDMPYSGTGVNQPCAFNDIRWLWSWNQTCYGTPDQLAACGWFWIGQNPGDTYYIGQKEGGWRVGWTSGESNHPVDNLGLIYSLDTPLPRFPSGSPENPIRFLGANYENCADDVAKTKLHAGFTANFVMDFRNTTNAYAACMDLSDQVECGSCASAVNKTCNHGDFPLPDLAFNGVVSNYLTENVTVVDFNVHGFYNNGWQGPTGPNTNLLRIKINGNSCSGLNTDDLGVNGHGHLNISYFQLIGNGCVEMYPIDTSYKYPYNYCVDQNAGGYGDAFGTGDGVNEPAWIIHFDHGEVAYNTQDGLDALHLDGIDSHGVTSQVIITNTISYGNMGDQIKTGSAGVIQNTIIYDNPTAMGENIPGFPPGFNKVLTQFGRGGSGLTLSVAPGTVSIVEHVTMFSSSQVAIGVNVGGHQNLACWNYTSDPKTQCSIIFRNNLNLGFPCSIENGWGPLNCGTRVSERIYCDSIIPQQQNPLCHQSVFNISSSTFTNNAVWGDYEYDSCPNTDFGDKKAVCSDPGLFVETYSLYGYGNPLVANKSSPLIKAGVYTLEYDFNGYPRANPPTIGAFEYGTPAINVSWSNAPISSSTGRTSAGQTSAVQTSAGQTSFIGVSFALIFLLAL